MEQALQGQFHPLTLWPLVLFHPQNRVYTGSLSTNKVEVCELIQAEGAYAREKVFEALCFVLGIQADFISRSIVYLCLF